MWQDDGRISILLMHNKEFNSVVPAVMHDEFKGAVQESFTLCFQLFINRNLVLEQFGSKMSIPEATVE